jgi:hypothetical protein
MKLRQLIVRNLGWKLLSLLLGILVYVLVLARIEGELILLRGTAEATFERSVAVLASPELDGVFRVTPRLVSVRISGRRDALARLSPSDIRAYVDLTDVMTAMEVRRRVLLQPLPTVVRVEILPSTVRIEYLPASPAAGPPRPTESDGREEP